MEEKAKLVSFCFFFLLFFSLSLFERSFFFGLHVTVFINTETLTEIYILEFICIDQQTRHLWL